MKLCVEITVENAAKSLVEVRCFSLRCPSMKAFFRHRREPLRGYQCLLVACQCLISSSG